MNKFLCSAFAVFVVSSMAHAEDFYVGATIGLPAGGHLQWTDKGVATERDADKKATPVGLFAGYVLSPDWALEAGYRGASGAATFDLAPGDQFKTRTSAAYAAARGTWKLSEDWSLFGKVGIAQGRMKLGIRGKDAPGEESVRKTGAYLSLGASYLVAKDVAVQLQLEHMDKLKYEGLSASMDRFSLGLRIGF
jgi:OOP family OmpA-OmpF porin